MPGVSLRFAAVARTLDPDLRAAAARARACGFGGLQVDAITRALDLTRLSLTGYRELRHLLAGQGQSPVALRAETGPEGLGPKADVDRVIDRADGVLRAAAALGPPVVCLDVGRLPPAPRVAAARPKVTPAMAGLLVLPDPPAGPPEDAPPAPPPDAAALAHWQRALAALGDVADRYGVVVALSATLSPLAALHAVVRAAACPWFGVDFDPSAVLRDEWTADEFFDALGPLVRHVRARDAVRGEAGRTKPATLGRGDVPWRQVLALLDGSGYHAAVTIDTTDLPDPAVAAVAGLRQLRAVLESA